jgi:hypothetical protein
MKITMAMMSLALACSACMPVTKLVTYEPAMDHGVVLTEKCIGWKSLEYRAGDAVVTATLLRWPLARHHHPVLRTRIKAPVDAVVAPAASSIAVVSPHLAAPVRLPSGGSAGQLDVSLAAIPEGDLQIQLPDLIVNGRRYPIPVMQFQQKWHAVSLLPLNC